MAKIRPINKTDLVELNGMITNSRTEQIVGTGASVTSADVFGTKETDETWDSAKPYNNRGYISFDIPVLNPFLAGTNYSVWTCIFGDHIAKVAKGELIYDTEEGTFISGSSIDKTGALYSKRYLIGGDYLLYMLDNLDAESDIKHILAGIVFAAVKKIVFKDIKFEDAEDEIVGWIKSYSGDLFLIDKYYVDLPTMSEGELKLVKNKIDKELCKIVQNTNSKLIYLIAIRDDDSAMRGQIMNYIEVLPYGYRPDNGRAVDDWTTAYDNVLRTAREISNQLTSTSVKLKLIRQHYVDLVITVRHVMVENTNIYKPEYKPILDKLKGKKGLIRDKMQGTRIDFSGRSVIVSDPNMSLDTIGVPIDMLAEMFGPELLKRDRESENKVASDTSILTGKITPKKKNMIIDIAKDSYIVTGRQPTLYNLGMRAFKIKPVEGKAIVLNSLSTVAFNADFDGDQMYLFTATTEAAKRELKCLLGSEHNMFLPRNGECHIAPRQEIIHGLWKASIATTNNVNTRNLTVGSYKELLDGVCDGTIMIYDKVTVAGNTEAAGVMAIRACLIPEVRGVRLGVMPITFDKKVPEKPVTEKFFKELNKYLILNHKTEVINIINNTVRLGFAVTNIFSPSIPIVNYPDVESMKLEFEKSIAEREEYYYMGLDTESAYASYYSNAYRELESKMKKFISQELGSNNGFVEMKESGARGNDSNLMQMFGMKGRVKKNEYESFNVIMRNSHVSQLNTLEHAITAYGGREGLIDKSIETYGPGYFSRKLSHTTSPYSIVAKDCGDTEGILIDYNFIKQFLGSSILDEELANNKYVKDIVISMLIGRYITEEPFMIETKQEALRVYETYIAVEDTQTKSLIIKDGVHLRSPISCKNPCCAKCWGLSMTTNKPAIVGEPVGALTSGSIGEPGTQLIMKNFQNGGVAGITNLTSSFDLTSQYAHLSDMRETGQALPYDFIAPVEGKIVTVSKGNGLKLLHIMQQDEKGRWKNKLTKKILLHEDIELKSYVTVGESIQKKPGNLNMCEVIEFHGVKYAQKYLATILFNTYRPEAFVSFKYFELLAMAMSFKICRKGNDYFKTGRFYTMQEYYAHDTEGCEFFDTMKGIGQVPLCRNDLFSTMFMENMVQGVSRAIILSGQDEMKLPIVRYSFGLGLGYGSDVPGYIEARSVY